MAKRELSSTLRNLKFMQRSAPKKEEEKKKNDEEPNGSFPSLGTVAKKCVVITDWDPQPGALLGRMSFQSFNPSIEKLNEEATNVQKTDASPSSSSSNGGRMSFREPESSNGDLKRKQSEIVPEEQNHPNKSPRSNSNSTPSNRKGDGFKKPKSRKADWSVLKPPKCQTKKG